MLLIENILICWRIFRANKLRTILTIFGVMVGVAGVVAMMSLATGAKKLLDTEINRTGSTFEVHRPRWIQNPKNGQWGPNKSLARFTIEDLKFIRHR